jgi:hypothetical protein
MKFSALGIAVLLAGCASAKETFTPDGRKGHVISCPSGAGAFGQLTNWGTCFQKAGDICQARGYTILTRSDEPGFAAVADRYGAAAGTTTNRMMIIQCKDVADVMPPLPSKAK